MSEHDPREHDPKEEQEARHEAEYQQQLRDQNDLRELLQTPEGRRVIARILNKTGMFRRSFTGNSTTFYNEGRRDIGLEVVDDIINAGGVRAYTQILEEQSDG